jgi:hypothetical protein
MRKSFSALKAAARLLDVPVSDVPKVVKNIQQQVAELHARARVIR